MKTLLINPPHTAIGSRIPGEHLPPLGLLSVAGPLIDSGFSVELLDADRENLTLRQIADEVLRRQPEVIMLGHSGSSSVHATVAALSQRLKKVMPELVIIYGGLYPSYHWDEILCKNAGIDIIVRGEGEQTTLKLMLALYHEDRLDSVAGIAFRRGGHAIATARATMISRLDDYRVAWELINHRHYTYWGGKRAVVVQFSRGCPYQCSYCGQRGYWTQWRHRNPVKLAQELARLYREKGVELINFADELPTASRRTWKAFLEALIAEDVPLLLVGSTRAGDIVRDADILHLYRRAGVVRFLLGIESYDEATLQAIKKGASPSEDQKAIALLRQHGIISMATYVVGFQEESDSDYWRSFKHLLRYDPDQIQLLYATPHRWTPFYRSVQERQVIQTDTRRWDYKHQVLATPGVPPWRVFMWFKLIEGLLQVRPKALVRLLFHPDSDYRHAMRWYTRIGRKVWFHEVYEFLFKARPARSGPTLHDFMGSSLEEREYVLAKPTSLKRAPRRPMTADSAH
jgi:anaerobic magnesium-protoporphyrin IX monomethyl ester cyclase